MRDPISPPLEKPLHCVSQRVACPGEGSGFGGEAKRVRVGSWFARMQSASVCTTMRCMSSYAVFWQYGCGIAFHGRLDFVADGFRLRGGEPGHDLRVEVAYGEVVAVEQDSRTRIGSSQAIRIRTRAAGSLLVASAGDAGMLGEIQQLLRHAPPESLASVG